MIKLALFPFLTLFEGPFCEENLIDTGIAGNQ